MRLAIKTCLTGESTADSPGESDVRSMTLDITVGAVDECALDFPFQAWPEVLSGSESVEETMDAYIGGTWMQGCRRGRTNFNLICQSHGRSKLSRLSNATIS